MLLWIWNNPKTNETTYSYGDKFDKTLKDNGYKCIAGVNAWDPKVIRPGGPKEGRGDNRMEPAREHIGIFKKKKRTSIKSRKKKEQMIL